MEANASGNLSHKPVLPLLVELHQQNATGSLKLERSPLQKAVYLREGQILFAASNDPKDQLASILVEEGKLGPDQMAVAQARVSAGNPLAKVLTELGYVSQRELADAARLKVEKILTDLYSWKEGSFQFAEGSLPKGAIDLELSTPRLLFNSMRRIEDREWVLSQLGSLDAVLAAGASFESFVAAAKPEGRAEDVLGLVDGVKTVKQIGAVSPLGEFEVCKILAAALQLGALEKKPAPFSGLAQEALAAPKTTRPPSADLETLFESVSSGTGARASPGAGKRLSLGEEEGRGHPRNKRAADFLIEEPPSPRPLAGAGPRSGPGARKGARTKTGSRWGKVGLLTLLLLLIAGGGYYFLVYAPSTTKRGPAPSSSARPGLPSPQQPLPSSTVPAGSATSAAGATAPSPSGTPGAGSSQLPTGGSAVGATPPGPSVPLTSAGQPQLPMAQGPPPSGGGAQRPAPSSPGAPPMARPAPLQGAGSPPQGQPSRGGLSLLKSGEYSQAASAFQQQYQQTGSGKFTVQVMLACKSESVTNAVRMAGGASELFILPINYSGRSCYRVCWGLFDSRETAEKAVSSLPPDFLKGTSRPGPMPISRALK